MILTEDRAASKPVCQGYVSLLSQSFEYPIYRVLAAAIRTARASQQIFGVCDQSLHCYWNKAPVTNPSSSAPS